MRKSFDFAIGWSLVVAGVAMLALPGPGLLGLLAGLVILSNSYPFARRFTEPVRVMAHRAAKESVEAWWRIALGVAGGATLIACGIVWAQVGWLPFSGLGTGIPLMISGVIAWGLLAYSWHVYRPLVRAERDNRGVRVNQDA
ncbi:MAG TPA: PGPGW domain-containing protein [Jiangellaceae bacterium]|nr:PGPGW domain-containing protein [Jiangellaceae bacterium]